MTDSTQSHSGSPAAPAPRPGVLNIVPYRSGPADAWPLPDGARLSLNEAALGPSPRAVAAYAAAASRLGRYGDAMAIDLKAALHAAHGYEPERLVIGNGSEELLYILARAYLGPGDEGLFSELGFLVYRIAVQGAGATPVAVPERDFTADVDALIAAVSPRTRVLFLANPNNPTGTCLPFAEVQRLHAALPSNVLLVLDAAYSDYVSRNDYEIGIELVATTENTVMTHTFSKIHGLASLRIGWMFGPANIVDAVNRIRGPFNVSTPAMLAAVAAIEDSAHIQMSKAHTEKWRSWLTDEVTKLGFKVTPSVANFILIHFPLDQGKTAGDADAFLTRRGLVLRGLANYGLPHALRLTIGTEEANRLVVDGLRDFVAGK